MMGFGSSLGLAPVLFGCAADILVIVHLLFICFVVFGGLLVLRWRWVMFFHIPAAVWGALLEFLGWICPLTPLEHKLREMAGEEGFAEGFIEYYLLPLVYPGDLTREVQIYLGLFVVLVNITLYLVIALKRMETKGDMR